MSEHIDLSQDAGVLTIRMNRPERKNALTADMYAAMGDALKKADADSDCRVALFLGTEGIYTAGNDIKDFLETPPVGPDAPVSGFIGFLARTDLPLVAAVDGPAVGIGTTMLLHCDFVHVTETAMLQMPFVDLALVPEAGSSFLLPRLMGARPGGGAAAPRQAVRWPRGGGTRHREPPDSGGRARGGRL